MFDSLAPASCVLRTDSKLRLVRVTRSTLASYPLPMDSLPLLAAAGVAALSAYVHFTCIKALGPNATDNSVLLHPAVLPASDPITPPLVCVVLGWGGATQKQLRRIINHCTTVLGCPVISYINPMLQFLEGELHAPSIESILQLLAAQFPPPGSSPLSSLTPSAPTGFVVIVHSNNGSFVYGELKRRIHSRSSQYSHLKDRLRGVVFDSAPALLGGRGPPSNPISALWHSARQAFGFTFPAVAIVLGRAQYVHVLWTPAIAIWVAVMKALVALRRAVAGRKDADEAGGKPDEARGDVRRMLADRLSNDVPAVPHLFLYSSADALVRKRYVESYIALLREQKSLKVIVHDFERTGHVQHFLKEPEIYARELKRFLESLQQAQLVKRTLSAAQGRM